MKTVIKFLFPAIFTLIFFPGCQNPVDKSITFSSVDYSEAQHWLSIPANIYPVDVFYLYPTAWTSTSSLPEVCTIDDTSMLRKASFAYLRQATAFEGIANIYAPYYRQANLTPDALSIVSGTPTTDATMAFDYYIKHFNNGRPYILAGHSQGSTILSNLLAGYLKDNPEVYSRMVAAYVIGYPITKDYLNNNQHLKFATGPDDIGVIISYNTEKPNLTITNPILWGMTGIVINPITWTRDQTLATMEQGLGSFMPDSNEVFSAVPQCADARVDTLKGVIIANTTYANLLEPTFHGIYHGFDYSFYYFNIRQNAINRINHYLNK